MVIGLLVLELLIPEVTTLKQRRMVINSLKDTVRNKFNVSISDVGEEGARNQCTLAVAHVSCETKYSNQVLSKIVDHLEQSRKVLIQDYSLTFL